MDIKIARYVRHSVVCRTQKNAAEAPNYHVTLLRTVSGYQALKAGAIGYLLKSSHSSRYLTLFETAAGGGAQVHHIASKVV